MTNNDTVKMTFQVECEIPAGMATWAVHLIEHQIEKGIETSGDESGTIHAVATLIPALTVELVLMDPAARFQPGDEIMWDSRDYGPNQLATVLDMVDGHIRIMKPLYGGRITARLLLDPANERLNIRKI